MALTAAQMITYVRDRFGEDSTSATQVSDAQILKFLNHRMSELGADAWMLPSGWTASTVSGQQQYSVPPEYTNVESISLYDATAPNNRYWLTKCEIEDIDATRPPGNPIRFAVWGLNVSGDNSPAFWLDPIPNYSGSSNLTCYGYQTVKDMVSGGQGPEVRLRWQYAAVTGALALVYYRLAEGSLDCLALGDRAEAQWQREKSEAMKQSQSDIRALGPPKDVMGYTTRYYG